MKTIFESAIRRDLINRIYNLNEQSRPSWGKMTMYQMLRHCILSEEMFLGKKQYKRLFIGKLFGKMALKSILKDENPMKHNQPTHPEFKINGTGSAEAEKKRWAILINEYDSFSNPDFVHPFFGSMTKEQIGQYVYKHTDHHLRQFNS